MTRFARAVRRCSLRSAALALAFTLSLAALSLLVGGRAGALLEWVEVGRADFTGLADGPGDGKAHAAAIGTVTTSTASGKNLKDVASSSGISRERLVLSDNGTGGCTDIGYRIGASSAASGAFYGSFIVEPQSDTGSFDFACTDSDKSDFCVPGSAGDGATVEMFCIRVDDGVVTVGGKSLKSLLKKGGRYRIEAALYDVTEGSDAFEFWLTNLSTGEVEYATGALGSSYKSVRALTLKKRAGKVGDFAFDDFLLLAPAK